MKEFAEGTRNQRNKTKAFVKIQGLKRKREREREQVCRENPAISEIKKVKIQGLKTHKEERNESVGGTLAIGGTTEVGRETDTRCGII